MQHRTGWWVPRAVAGVAVLLALALLLGALLAGLLAGPLPGPVDVTGARLTPGTSQERRTEVLLRRAGAFAVRQLARTERRLPAGRFPTVAPRQRWRTSDSSGWLAGFYPGQLWLAYEATGNPVWARRAAARQADLAARQHDTSTHDLGFLLQTSFGRGARLTGSEADLAVTLRAAETLAGRWVPTAGAIRSWDGPPGEVTVIVDSLVNLELLFAAAGAAGQPVWRDLALRHARTVKRHLLRPDGSTTHVVRFDERTGKRVWRGTVQGLSDTSTWARGQAWAVYGFSGAWRDTGDRRMLAAARRAAGFAVAHLPRDGVPRWDYDARDGVRDTTAAAVLASAMVELARVDPDPTQRAAHRRAGLRILRALAGPRYLARGTGSPAVLLHGRHSPRHPDAGVTYGDHYVLEAILRTRLLPSRAPALASRTAAPTRPRVTIDLERVRRVSAVSVRWRDGAEQATPFRITTSRDGRTWRVGARGVSSGRVASAETYDLVDRPARYVRLTVPGTGQVDRLTVRG